MLSSTLNGQLIKYQNIFAISSFGKKKLKLIFSS